MKTKYIDTSPTLKTGTDVIQASFGEVNRLLSWTWIVYLLEIDSSAVTTMQCFHIPKKPYYILNRSQEPTFLALELFDPTLVQMSQDL